MRGNQAKVKPRQFDLIGFGGGLTGGHAVKGVPTAAPEVGWWRNTPPPVTRRRAACGGGRCAGCTTWPADPKAAAEDNETPKLGPETSLRIAQQLINSQLAPVQA